MDISVDCRRVLKHRDAYRLGVFFLSCDIHNLLEIGRRYHTPFLEPLLRRCIVTVPTLVTAVTIRF